MDSFQAYAEFSHFLDTANIVGYYFTVLLVTVFVSLILIVTPIFAFRVSLTNAIENEKKNDNSFPAYAYAKASFIGIVIFLSATFCLEFIFVNVLEVWGGIGEIVSTVFFLGY